MTERFEFIDAEYAAYQESDDTCVPSIVKMCEWIEVSRSGFYEWRKAPESATAKRRQELALIITKSFEDSNETYGYRRVHADLLDWGVAAGPELVRSIMRELGPEQAATFRRNDPGFWNGVLPNLMFPADHSWLVSTLWDDDWSCIGGSASLVASFLRHPDLQARPVMLGQDATPPGHQAL